MSSQYTGTPRSPEGNESLSFTPEIQQSRILTNTHHPPPITIDIPNSPNDQQHAQIHTTVQDHQLNQQLQHPYQVASVEMSNHQPSTDDSNHHSIAINDPTTTTTTSSNVPIASPASDAHLRYQTQQTIQPVTTVAQTNGIGNQQLQSNNQYSTLGSKAGINAQIERALNPHGKKQYIIAHLGETTSKHCQ